MAAKKKTTVIESQNGAALVAKELALDCITLENINRLINENLHLTEHDQLRTAVDPEYIKLCRWSVQAYAKLEKIAGPENVQLLVDYCDNNTDISRIRELASFHLGWAAAMRMFSIGGRP